MYCQRGPLFPIILLGDLGVPKSKEGYLLPTKKIRNNKNLYLFQLLLA